MKKIFVSFLLLTFSLFFSQKYSLELNLEKGKIYASKTDAIVRTQVEVMGQRQELLMNMLTTLSIEVKDLKADIYTLEAKHKYYQLQLLISDNYQSNTSDAGEENPLSKGFASVVDVPFTIKINKKGDVLEVNGYEIVMEKLLQYFAQDQKEIMKEQLKKSFSEDAIKNSFSAVTSHIPPQKSIQINETWQRNINNTDPTLKTYTITYKFMKADKEYYYISGEGTGKSDPNDFIENMGFKFNPDIQTTSKINLIVDKKTGWVKKSDIDLNSTGTMLAKDMGMTLNVNTITTSTIEDQLEVNSFEKERRIGVNPPPPAN